MSKNRKKRNYLREYEPKISTSIIAPLEILKISNRQKDFARRKAAILALDAIGTNIIKEDPDNIIRRSFGLPSIGNGVRIDKLIRGLTLASSYAQAIKGVNDFKNREVIKIYPMKIKEWKDNLSAYFTQAIVIGNKKMNDLFLRRLKEFYPDISDKDLNHVSKALNARSSGHDHSRNNAIVGLATRAGIFSEDELADALKSGRMNDLIEKAVAKYNGLVDSYLKMYLAFQMKMSDGRTPERNALFDLEFFTHLDAHNVKYLFVTTEAFWLKLGEENLAGRIIHLDSLF